MKKTACLALLIAAALALGGCAVSAEPAPAPEGATARAQVDWPKERLETEVTPVKVGDTVRMHVKVKEGSRERIQVFEGTVIAKKHGGITETITVRRISYGVGVEKVFPVHSPSIDKIEVVRNGAVRRAKLYYLRGRVGKGAKVKEKL